MGRSVVTSLLFVVVCLCGCKENVESVVTPDDPSKQISEAQLLYDHGLADESKRILFRVYRNSSLDQAHRAEALYWLASVAVNEGRFAVAAEDLERLTKEFPESSRGRAAGEMLNQLREVVQDVTRKDMSSPVAEAYLRNGNFWAREVDGFTIDSSWLPREDMAIEWYDRVIREFPNTSAAEEAFSKKIVAMLGWVDEGVYSKTTYGARRNASYLSGAEKTLEEMAQMFPSSGYLQALRYQIAQGYWRRKDWANTRRWLNAIVAEKKSGSDFYVQAAENRLKKIEY